MFEDVRYALRLLARSPGYAAVAMLTLAIGIGGTVAIFSAVYSVLLAPLPYRGKRNEPSYVVEVAKVLAEVRGVSFEEISRQTTENFFKLFSKVPRDAAQAA